jgi:hypothetical protein
VASPVFKTGVTRPGRAGWVRFPHSPATTAFFFASLLIGLSPVVETAGGQRVDSTRAGVAPPVRRAAQDTSTHLKVSPRSAFLTSLLVPGLAQLRLDRPKAATLFAVVEAGTIAMSVKSLNDLRKAKDARRDTVLTAIVDVEGNPVLDPKTGLPTFSSAPRDPNLVGRIKARRTHFEDWIAAVVFNHLFAGADAYVAANLSDFDTNVEVSATGTGMRLMARVAW